MAPKFKILVVDDHAVFRDGLAMILDKESDLSVCAQCEDATSALKAAQTFRPQMAIVDIGLEGTNGIDLTKTLRARYPEIRILVLSMHKEFLYAERALRAGANGYIMKQESGRTLMAAVRKVLRGESYVSEAMHELLLQNIRASDRQPSVSPISRLSDRELDVFQLIAKGYGTRQIAEALHVSMKTVETHREHIRDKMDLRNTFELNQFAVEWLVSQRTSLSSH